MLRFKHQGGPVRGGRFPGFRGNISILAAFPSFFSNFPVSATSHCLFSFSGFPQLLKIVFRFPQLLERVSRFPQIFLSFPAFCDLRMAFSGFRQSSLFQFSAGYFGLFWFSATFLGVFRLSAIYFSPPHQVSHRQ